MRKRSREVAMEHEDDDEPTAEEEEAPVIEEKPKKEKRQKLHTEKPAPEPELPPTPVVTEGPKKRGRKSSVAVAPSVVEITPEPKPRRSCTIKETKEPDPKSMLTCLKYFPFEITVSVFS
jgi:hypothetical protein